MVDVVYTIFKEPNESVIGIHNFENKKIRILEGTDICKYASKGCKSFSSPTIRENFCNENSNYCAVFKENEKNGGLF